MEYMEKMKQEMREQASLTSSTRSTTSSSTEASITTAMPPPPPEGSVTINIPEESILSNDLVESIKLVI